MSGSSLRVPRISVLSDGILLPNLLDADILQNAHFAAARFRLRLAADPRRPRPPCSSLAAVIDIQLTPRRQVPPASCKARPTPFARTS